MIRIRITLDAAGRPVGFEARGHARYAPHGEDIVCAAVSAMTQMAIVGLEDVAGARVTRVLEEGCVSCRLLSGGNDDAAARVLLETVRLSLRQLAQQYPRLIGFEEKRTRSRSAGQDEETSAAPGTVLRTPASSPRKRRRRTSAQEASHE